MVTYVKVFGKNFVYTKFSYGETESLHVAQYQNTDSHLLDEVPRNYMFLMPNKKFTMEKSCFYLK